jgi:hypothetical protein
MALKAFSASLADSQESATSSSLALRLAHKAYRRRRRARLLAACSGDAAQAAAVLRLIRTGKNLEVGIR